MASKYTFLFINSTSEDWHTNAYKKVIISGELLEKYIKKTGINLDMVVTSDTPVVNYSADLKFSASNPVALMFKEPRMVDGELLHFAHAKGYSKSKLFITCTVPSGRTINFRIQHFETDIIKNKAFLPLHEIQCSLRNQLLSIDLKNDEEVAFAIRHLSHDKDLTLKLREGQTSAWKYLHKGKIYKERYYCYGHTQGIPAHDWFFTSYARDVFSTFKGIALEGFTQALDYVLKRSCFSSLYYTGGLSTEEIRERGLMVDTHHKWIDVYTALITLRMAGNHGPTSALYYKLREEGVKESVAYVLMNFLSLRSSGDHYYDLVVINWKGSHATFKNNAPFLDCVQFLETHEPVYEKGGFCVNKRPRIDGTNVFVHASKVDKPSSNRKGIAKYCIDKYMTGYEMKNVTVSEFVKDLCEEFGEDNVKE